MVCVSVEVDMLVNRRASATTNLLMVKSTNMSRFSAFEADRKNRNSCFATFQNYYMV